MATTDFNFRQHVSLKLIFLALKIVQPMQYAHELSAALDEIEKIVKGEVK